MANTKDIKDNIKSISDIRKITNAMYLISSTKLRRAKYEYDTTKPYFFELRREIKRIFRTAPEVESNYFYPKGHIPNVSNEPIACLVITADKGLAGSYNINVIKKAEKLLEGAPKSKLFVIGNYGRQAFLRNGQLIEQSFIYPAQHPTVQTSREISRIMLRYFNSDEFSRLYIIYTELTAENALEVRMERILPFHRNDFFPDDSEKSHKVFRFYPDVKTVLDNVIESYIVGYIYSGLVSSFCSEQYARMVAMSKAGDNADSLLVDLKSKYNLVRQSAITQEITEISSGTVAQKNRPEKDQKE